MNQLASDTPTKKRRLFLPITLVIFALALIGFFASRAGLDKALVKQQLDDFAVQLKERGKERGRDIQFTYGELEVTGGFSNKHLVIRDVAFIIQPLERKPLAANKKLPGDTLRITTPAAEIYPLSADLSSVKLLLPQPINVTDAEMPDRSLLKIESNTPPTFVFAQDKDNNTLFHRVEAQLPAEMILTYLREQQATGAEEKTPSIVPVYESLTIAMAPGGTFKSRMATDSTGLGEGSLALRDVLLTPKNAPEGKVTVTEVTGAWSNTLNEKKLNVVKTTAKFGPVTSELPSVPYLPIQFDLDAIYEGAMLKSPKSVAEAQSPDTSIKINRLNVASKEMNFVATADFVANASDVLPVGKANIMITNVPYALNEMRKYKIFSANSETFINDIIERISGMPLAEVKDLAIPIERARGGAFKIGKTTFEELFTVFLKQAIHIKPAQPKGTSLTPQLPSADKLKSTPIAVPDHGTRG